MSKARAPAEEKLRSALGHGCMLENLSFIKSIPPFRTGPACSNLQDPQGCRLLLRGSWQLVRILTT